MSLSKVCTKCEVTKPLNDFYKDGRTSDRRYSACKLCARKAAASWKMRNKKHVADYTKKYRDDNAEGVTEHMRAWRAANKNKLRVYWARWNPVCNAKRRAIKKWAVCYCCQDEDSQTNIAVAYAFARKLKMHVDHVKPLAKGGLHCINNLQLLTPVENMRKGARWTEPAGAAA